VFVVLWGGFVVEDESEGIREGRRSWKAFVIRSRISRSGGWSETIWDRAARACFRVAVGMSLPQLRLTIGIAVDG